MNLKIYSWANRPEFKNLTPFIWIDATANPIDEANKAFDALKLRVSGDRIFFFANSFPGMDNNLGDIPKRLVNDYRFDPSFYEDFFWQLHQLQAPRIDRIILDYEGGIGVWNNIASLTDDDRVTFIKSLYADPQVTSKMNAEMKSLKPEDFIYPWFKAFQAWNFWTTPMAVKAMNDCLILPLIHNLGYLPRVSNYGDLHPAFPIYDLNGWLLQDAGLTAESAPVLYLWGGQRTRGGAKHYTWNAFIDSLNYVRSCLNKGGCVPWISYPGFVGDNLPNGNPWMWSELIKHCVETGIKEFIYWNPAVPINTNDAFASALFLSLKTKPFLHLNEIPLDSDQVTTGALTTSYKDFVA